MLSEWERKRASKVLWIPPKKSLITSVKDITAIIKVELNEIKMMKSGLSFFPSSSLLFYDDTVKVLAIEHQY